MLSFFKEQVTCFLYYQEIRTFRVKEIQSSAGNKKRDPAKSPNPLNKVWCRRSDSNRHGHKVHWILSPARLPISSLRQRFKARIIMKISVYCQYDIDNPPPLALLLLKFGAVAQLGERMNGIHEVVGSIPISSTSNIKHLGKPPECFFYEVFQKI
jgi:hypothetical protein